MVTNNNTEVFSVLLKIFLQVTIFKSKFLKIVFFIRLVRTYYIYNRAILLLRMMLIIW
jgi:hypothetical protein